MNLAAGAAKRKESQISLSKVSIEKGKVHAHNENIDIDIEKHTADEPNSITDISESVNEGPSPLNP